jgi:hypothetical protein
VRAIIGGAHPWKNPHPIPRYKHTSLVPGITESQTVPRTLARNGLRNDYRNARETVVLYSGVMTQGTKAQDRRAGEISTRAASWLAWSAWVSTLVAMALAFLLASLNQPTSSGLVTACLSVVILAFSTVGALVASRRPENLIGWLFCCGSLCWGLGELALEYGVYALVSAPGALPAGVWAAWFGAWARGIGGFFMVLFLLLLFPTGRLPSRRWRVVAWAAVGYVVLFTLVSWLSPASQDLRLSSVRNPLGFDLEVMNLLGGVVYLTLPLPLLASGAAVVVRFRKSRGDERQQIKWFAYAVVVMVVLFTLGQSLGLTQVVLVAPLVFALPLTGLPVAAGIAILKYRLYEIDILINRTLVYGSLTVMLIALYFGVVVLLQSVFVALTGEQSTLAVVASTLLIAALFNPLRRRIQSFIDRRFYRSKYDARKTLEAFSSKLRDETNLEALNAELVGVVRETMQPERVSLWLREPSARRGRRPTVDGW